MGNVRITAHMVVKNEDQWVWFAVQSVLPFVDRFLITDTGSTDNTKKIISSINSDKIVYQEVHTQTRSEVTAARVTQIQNTHGGWIWVVDGDEVYTKRGAKEVVTAIRTGLYNIVVVRRYDLLGDVYHRQKESIGTYNVFGVSGHLLIRVVNKDALTGLTMKGDYPREGYFYHKGKNILDYDAKKVYITKKSLYHTMYLKRSSAGRNLTHMFNRSKYKIESGNMIKDTLPEVFSQPKPSFVPDPLAKRGLVYEVAAKLITPVKNLKRRMV